MVPTSSIVLSSKSAIHDKTTSESVIQNILTSSTTNYFTTAKVAVTNISGVPPSGLSNILQRTATQTDIAAVGRSNLILQSRGILAVADPISNNTLNTISVTNAGSYDITSTVAKAYSIVSTEPSTTKAQSNPLSDVDKPTWVKALSLKNAQEAKKRF